MQISGFIYALLWLQALTAKSILAQIILPSNSLTDLEPADSSARFLLNGTEFPSMLTVPLAPLAQYVNIARHDFLQVSVQGKLANIDNSNANQIQSNEFAYISCDPQSYNGYLTAVDAFNSVVWSPNADIIILYSVYQHHCNITLSSNTPQINGILTTTDPTTAAILANLNLTNSSPGQATLLPDLTSYTNTTGTSGYAGNQGVLGPSPTTAVAMIILYSITGIITALFIIIIFIGAIRAHRHPERYGPRNVPGRPRQSRAKGIARAMLETLPIVKFGDHIDEPVKDSTTSNTSDIEMTAGVTPNTEAAKDTTSPAVEGVETEKKDSDSGSGHKADGTTEDGTLGCSICTEDFNKGEEVRVLPCNHKFHPECVDPWLLNVSGTCPLCRIDLQPKKTEDGTEPVEGASSTADSALPPPLAVDETGAGEGPSERRDTGLAGAATGTVEERIAALRSHRAARRAGGGRESTDAERQGLTTRLRQKFRIRTVAQGQQERRDTISNTQTDPAIMENVDIRTESDRQAEQQRHREEARQGHWGARAYLASFWQTGDTGVSFSSLMPRRRIGTRDETNTTIR